MTTHADGSIDVEVDGHLATITINRPHVRNSIDLAAAKRLIEVVEQIEETNSIRVGIITGAGGIASFATPARCTSGRGESRWKTSTSTSTATW